MALTVEPLEAAREAFRRHAWSDAYDGFAAVDGVETLSGEDLEAMALAAWFTARPDEDIELLERAFHRYEAAGDPIRAAYIAIGIGRKLFYVSKASMAAGWIRRAERILGGDGDTYAHGYLALVRSEGAAATGDLDRALTLAEQAVAIGERTADADLKAWSWSQIGSIKVASGDTTEGIALLEEATIAAVNGELSPFTSGITACRMIGTCRDLTDYKRATEWIEATERYCDRQSLEGFPGVCRVHRAEVASMSGAWDRAESELEAATTELGRFQAQFAQGEGYYALGDVRRLKGDLAGAESAIREAHALGHTPQPALALVRLAQGDTKAAVASIDAAVAEETLDRWARARLLSAQVEIAVAAGTIERARTAADELADIVSTYRAPGLSAAAATASGRVDLAGGDHAGAASSLRRAVAGWREIGSPFEVAQARALLGRALRGLGDDVGADLETEAALEAFRSLGAAVAIAATERDLDAARARRGTPRTGRRTFMFTDIVGSTQLAEALGDAAWERLLRWHDETLRRLIERGAGTVVNTTGDGFFVAFESPAAAVEVAIGIQRALREHRESTGFAPSVRIGLHTGEANARGADYSGVAVHVAARVGALAGGGEIVATAETIRESGAATAGSITETTVKGVAAPIEVASIAWS